MKLFKFENLIIFLIVFSLAFSAGYFLNTQLKLIFGDALVRSFHAYLVFFGNEPKLSAIGFVWPPLQTLLQLPLVLIKPLNNNGLAGNVLTAIFFGITAVYINLFGAFFKVNRVFVYTILILFITNPLIFFYGSNGMSEIVGICFLLMTLYYFLKHIATNNMPSLMFSSLALSAALMTRWETGTLMLTLLGLLGLLPLLKKNSSFKEVESSMVMFVAPVLFTLFIWFVVSWLIVGSPIYFLHSTYSFTTQDAKNIAENSLLSEVKGSIVGSLMYALKRIGVLSLLFIPLVLISAFKLIRKNSRMYALTLLAFSLSVIFSQITPLFLGKSYGQLRYFIYAIPFSYIFLMFLFKDTVMFATKKYLTILLFVLAAATMIASSAFTIFAMSEYGNREESTMSKILLDRNYVYRNEVYEHEQSIAEYILAKVQPRSILVDDSLGFNIIYLTKSPHLFIERVDSDFDKILADPLHSKVEYMLITDPETASGVDSVSLAYPQMFKNGADFATLEEDFGDWRLYRLHDPEIKVATPITQTPPQPAPTGCEHIVESGESLWTIAENSLGSGRDYEKIVELNKAILLDPAKIKPGEKLAMECKSI